MAIMVAGTSRRPVHSFGGRARLSFRQRGALLFGSYGSPIILISRIAQHTKNISANLKVSLIVAEDDANDVQVAAADVFGECALVTEDCEDVAVRYYEYFPDARDYRATHGFEFYRLNLMRGRYIGGFGEIH